jgi:chromosome partitioning protein
VLDLVEGDGQDGGRAQPSLAPADGAVREPDVSDTAFPSEGPEPAATGSPGAPGGSGETGETVAAAAVERPPDAPDRTNALDPEHERRDGGTGDGAIAAPADRPTDARTRTDTAPGIEVAPGPGDPAGEDGPEQLHAVSTPEAEVVDVAAPAAPERVLRPLPRVIAVANQKGGVGKTTTTVNLGASLAESDRRVLVIDLDPQGNATTGLGINSRALDTSVYDVLLNDVPLEDCVEPTSVLNLFVAPASLDLAGAEIELVSVMSREGRLKRAIDEVKADYDYVLIDCPPSLGLLTVNALAAATEVMVPIQCEYYALEGLGQLMRNIDLVQRNLNPLLELSLIVLVMYDGRTKLGEQVAGEVREHFGSRVCRNVIPRNIRLSEAPSFGQPITTYDSSSSGAVAYRELAREVDGGSA